MIVMKEKKAIAADGRRMGYFSHCSLGYLIICFPVILGAAGDYCWIDARRRGAEALWGDGQWNWGIISLILAFSFAILSIS